MYLIIFFPYINHKLIIARITRVAKDLMIFPAVAVFSTDVVVPGSVVV